MKYGQKCDIIFKSQRDISMQIPDVNGKNIQDVKYEGSASMASLVTLPKEKLKRFRHSNYSQTNDTDEKNLPPPYSENPRFNPLYNNLAHTKHKSLTSNKYNSSDESKPAMKQTQILAPSSNDQSDPGNNSLPCSTNYSCSCLYPDLSVSYQVSVITDECPADL